MPNTMTKKMNLCTAGFQNTENRGDPETFQREHIKSQQWVENLCPTGMSVTLEWCPQVLGVWRTVRVKCEDKDIFRRVRLLLGLFENKLQT